MTIPCHITSRPIAHCQCGRHYRDHDGNLVSEVPGPMPVFKRVERGYALEDNEDGAKCTPQRPDCHDELDGPCGRRDCDHCAPYLEDGAKCTPIPRKYGDGYYTSGSERLPTNAEEERCPACQSITPGHADYCALDSREPQPCFRNQFGAPCCQVEDDWIKCRGGRWSPYLSGRDAPRTALLRSNLEALERLLRDNGGINHAVHHYEGRPESLISESGRRAIRDMVEGPFRSWARRDIHPLGFRCGNLPPVSDTFWAALEEWVERGASARKQLQSSVRQLLDVLDTARSKR